MNNMHFIIIKCIKYVTKCHIIYFIFIYSEHVINYINIYYILYHHAFTRMLMYRRSGKLHFRSDFSWNRTQDNHSSTVFRAQFVRSIDNGRHRTGDNATGPVATYQIHIAQRQSSAVYDCER